MEELINQYPQIILLIQLWELPWKGYALWIAANRKDKGWFIALFLLRTLAILDIIYIIFITKSKLPFLKKKTK